MRSRFVNSKGFTLIEILVVLALTITVMTLILRPLIDSLKITRTAEIIIRVQDNARFALSQISRDLSNAMYVYDDTANWTYFPINSAGGVSQIDPWNTAITPKVYFAKIDMVLPRCRGYCPNDPMHTPGGLDLHPNSPLRDAVPTCPAILPPPNNGVCGAELELRPVQPLTADTRIVRYFIGLKRPMEGYFNGNNQTLADAGDDNTFILYRAEFSLDDNLLFPKMDEFNQPLDTAEKRRQYSCFFYRSPTAGMDIAPNGRPYAENWRAISKPIVTLQDIDLITIERNLATGNPIVTPTVTFKPTTIQNDPLVPTTSGETNPSLADAPPQTYKASYGNWVLPYTITLEPEAIPGQPVPNYSFVARKGLNLFGGLDPKTDMCIYKMDSAGYPINLVWNITRYTNSRNDSIYDAGDVDSPYVPSFSDRECAFMVDAAKGTINFAIPNVIGGQCQSMNNTLGIGKAVALSDLFNSTDLNNSATNPDCRLILNCQPPSGTDLRVLPKATVVPGSVKIIAPDGRSTAMPTSTGTMPLVQYALTPYFIRDPGINQFSVDYQYGLNWIGNPAYGTAAVYFNKSRSLSGSTATGIPEGTNNVLVYYEVQNNRKGDILRASYTTKSVITVRMGIRIFDPGAKKHQTVQFTNKVHLKNVAR